MIIPHVPPFLSQPPIQSACDMCSHDRLFAKIREFGIKGMLELAALRKGDPLESLYGVVRYNDLDLPRDSFTPVPR
jgi:hypothetical protein